MRGPFILDHCPQLLSSAKGAIHPFTSFFKPSPRLMHRWRKPGLFDTISVMNKSVQFPSNLMFHTDTVRNLILLIRRDLKLFIIESSFAHHLCDVGSMLVRYFEEFRFLKENFPIQIIIIMEFFYSWCIVKNLK